MKYKEWLNVRCYYGGGSLGINLASFLISDEHDVTLIESNEKLCHNASSELDALVICGKGTDKKILEEINLDEADVFVAATENDETNLMACGLVKGYKVPKIIARVSDHSHGEAFKRLGINSVFYPDVTLARYLKKLIIRPKIDNLMVFGKGEAELLDFTIDQEETIGKKIGDISPTDDYIIVAVYENGKIVIPKPDMVLKEGMKVSMLVKTKFVQEVLKRFTKL